MRIVNPGSLAATIDVVNEIFFYGKTFTKSQKEEIAKWIASRQGLPGSYAHMFAPTDYDFKKGIRLFTGERIRRGAAIGHILGEEACRTLLLLNVKENDIKNGLKRVTKGMLGALQYQGRRQIGWYCCGICSSSCWRHLAAGGLNNNRKRLAAGLLILKNCAITKVRGTACHFSIRFWH